MEKLDDASRFAWACGVFGLQPGASQSAIRSAVMAQLESADFMPPVAWRQAIWLLCDSRAPQAWPQTGFDAFRDTAEHELAEEIEALATQFFTLPADLRRDRWTLLLRQAEGFPRLQARLHAWQPGLDAETVPPAEANHFDTILVERICRLFVLKPGPQQAQRRDYLASMTGDWQPVVGRLRAKYPRLARLSGEFLDALVVENRQAAAQPGGGASAARGAAEPIAGPRTPARLPTPAPRRQPVRTAPASYSASFSRGGGAWVGLLVIILIRVISQMSGSLSTTNYQPPSSWPPYQASPSPSPTYGRNFGPSSDDATTAATPSFEGLRRKLDAQYGSARKDSGGTARNLPSLQPPAAGPAEKPEIFPPYLPSSAESPFKLQPSGSASLQPAAPRGPP